MQLHAKVLNVSVKKNPAFNTQTGDPDPSYFLEATVVDTETFERYQCSFRETPEVDLLQKAYNEKWPEAERDALAAQIEAEAKQQFPENQEATLVVTGFREKKGHVTLLVRKA